MGAVMFYNASTGFGMTSRVASATTGTRVNIPVLKGEIIGLYYDGSISSPTGQFFRFFYAEGSEND